VGCSFVKPTLIEALSSRRPPGSYQKHLQDFVRFWHLTGWRRLEIAGLRWEHIDRSANLDPKPGCPKKETVTG